VSREVDAGSETIKVNLPAVITADLRLNEPRYPALPNIMKARSKPMDTKTPEDYGVDITPRIKTLKVEEPSKRKAGIKVESTEELVEKLKAAGVI
ncbi:MAG: electron transfer flavoprotein subunit beta, partial [Alphaproteobacteria bacterium CG11_big_fil_rev_8_21_14_0_20_39_49]